MQPIRRTDLTFLVLLALASIYAFWGVPALPFHPDESTQLFMSADLETLFSAPRSMGWRPDQRADLRQRYRELDAPLTRYLAGLGRMLASLPALPVDWNWGLSWDENAAAGALPSPGLLAAGRFAITALFPLTLVFTYLAAKRLLTGAFPLLAALLVAANALVLLHARRVMAEGALVFGVAFFLWAILAHPERGWLVGLAVGLAFNAKQSTAALLPIGIMAVLWLPLSDNVGWRRRVLQAGAVIAAFMLITFALNPFLWSKPLRAAADALSFRQEFVAGQVATLEAVDPTFVLRTPVQRLVALLAHAFFASPAIADVANYIAQTDASQARYLANPLNHLLRSLPGGGLLLLLALFGAAVLALDALRASGDARRSAALLLSAAGIQLLALVVTVAIPYQRYVMPLVPFACLFAAAGLERLICLFPPSKRWPLAG